jgi:hypothetical protein
VLSVPQLCFVVIVHEIGEQFCRGTFCWVRNPTQGKNFGRQIKKLNSVTLCCSCFFRNITLRLLRLLYALSMGYRLSFYQNAICPSFENYLWVSYMSHIKRAIVFLKKINRLFIIRTTQCVSCEVENLFMGKASDTCQVQGSFLPIEANLEETHKLTRCSSLW